MQTLQWHSAWDKTISEQDRLIIEEHFHKTKDTNEDMTFIREATNHRQQLLVITIIHNRSTDDRTITNEIIAYTNNQNKTYENSFTLPTIVPANTSMPWTFIFLQDHIKRTTSTNNQIKKIKGV